MIDKILRNAHFLIFFFKNYNLFKAWHLRGYTENSPPNVKRNMLKARSVPNAIWIETGTFLGNTTIFLSKISRVVYTIEPEENLYQKAKKRFTNKNIVPIMGKSEDILPDLLPKLKGKINFWLDGHYSRGETFKGNTDCPIIMELEAIKKNKNNFNEIVIFIDDMRSFFNNFGEYKDYVSVDYLLNWVNEENFKWRIENDIMIITKKFKIHDNN